MLKTITLLFVAAFLGGCADSEQSITLNDTTVHTLNRNYANAHLVTTPQGSILIESGFDTGAENFVQWLRDKQVEPKDLKAVIVTHAHHDHAGGAKYLQEKYGVPIVAGAPDVPQLLLGKNDKLCPTDFVAEWLYEENQQATYPPVTPDLAIDKSVTLAEVTGVPDFQGVVHLLPGHTAGSLIVTLGDMAFVGDLFRGGVLTNTAERHLFMCDLDDNDKDIDRLLKDIGKDTQLFFPSHFGPVDRESLAAMQAD